MKIGELDQRCDECSVIDYCGYSFCYCLCTDDRFTNMEESKFKEIADNAINIEEYESCKGCTRPDCGVYRYSKEDYADEPCDFEDESRDYYCEQVADFVHEQVLLEMEESKKN